MDHPYDLQTLIHSFTPEHGIISGYPQFDAAPKPWKKVVEQHYNRRVDIDELSHEFWAYCHFMIYSNEFFEKFNYKEPDILWGHGFEALLVYFCKAVGMKWKWCCQTRLNNVRKGSTKHHKRADRRMNTGVSRSLHTSPDPEKKTCYIIFDNKVADFDLASIAARFDAIFSEGTKVGLGWHRPEDGSNPVQYVPDMSNYDSNGEHKDPKKLHEYIMKHLFLSSEALDYEELLNSFCFVRIKE